MANYWAAWCARRSYSSTSKLNRSGRDLLLVVMLHMCHLGNRFDLLILLNLGSYGKHWAGFGINVLARSLILTPTVQVSYNVILGSIAWHQVFAWLCVFHMWTVVVHSHSVVMFMLVLCDYQGNNIQWDLISENLQIPRSVK